MDDTARRDALKRNVNDILAVTEEGGCKKIVPQAHCVPKRRFAERLRRFFRCRLDIAKMHGADGPERG